MQLCRIVDIGVVPVLSRNGFIQIKIALTALLRFRFTDAFMLCHLYMPGNAYVHMCKPKNDFQKKTFRHQKSGPESRHVGHVNNTVIGDSTRGYNYIHY